MGELGKWLILVGFGIIFVGSLIWLGTKIGIPFGKLPGDISVSGEKSSFYFPIVTCLILSVLLTIIINVVLAFFRK